MNHTTTDALMPCDIQYWYSAQVCVFLLYSYSMQFLCSSNANHNKRTLTRIPAVGTRERASRRAQSRCARAGGSRRTRRRRRARSGGLPPAAHATRTASRASAGGRVRVTRWAHRCSSAPSSTPARADSTSKSSNSSSNSRAAAGAARGRPRRAAGRRTPSSHAPTARAARAAASRAHSRTRC